MSGAFAFAVEATRLREVIEKLEPMEALCFRSSARNDRISGWTFPR
jgi:hypothetical protein